MHNAGFFISHLSMEPHIEGGFFKEIYRNPFQIRSLSSLNAIGEERSLATTIYFLLESGQYSKFHKLKSDEIWFYHYGCGMTIHLITAKGEYRCEKLGIDLEKGEKPQVLIEANTVFGAEPSETNSFSLVSCMVSPGFDYKDFTLYKEKELSLQYPQHLDIIKKLNGNG